MSTVLKCSSSTMSHVFYRAHDVLHIHIDRVWCTCWTASLNYCLIHSSCIVHVFVLFVSYCSCRLCCVAIILQSSNFNVLHEYFAVEIFTGIHKNVTTSLIASGTRVMEEKLVLELCVRVTMFIKTVGKQLSVQCEWETRNTKDRYTIVVKKTAQWSDIDWEKSPTFARSSTMRKHCLLRVRQAEILSWPTSRRPWNSMCTEVHRAINRCAKVEEVD